MVIRNFAFRTNRELTSATIKVSYQWPIADRVFLNRRPDIVPLCKGLVKVQKLPIALHPIATSHSRMTTTWSRWVPIHLYTQLVGTDEVEGMYNERF